MTTPSTPSTSTQSDEKSDERISITVTWRAIPSIRDGASASFTVSRKLKAGQVAMLPPPLNVRQAQVNLSEARVGVVHRNVALHASLTLEDLLKLHGAKTRELSMLGMLSDTSVFSLELMPAQLILERYGREKLTKAPVPYASSIKTRYMTSVQLFEYLKAHGVEVPEGLGTPRTVLRELAAEIEDGYR
ncbi:hypothetical protein KFE25_001934 [Diacronema lutheri]|uniref:Uncharacterized protein n=1 Tax=Diacronema lutheri TaxID=2081491 RepID=A0A8J6CFZ8_DIALT|nr:hypothetical protein KFE25_001934 [Diacronema lutheri]